jgi:hypothetical protein
MIVLPRGWTVIQELDRVSLVHPEGRAVATIDYRERLRPLLTAGALLRRHLAGHPELVCPELPDSVERMTTLEGEYAAVATLTGTERGAPAQHDLGFVFGDDFYAEIAATCRRPASFDELTALVRDLVINDTHMLGLRRRRFEYAPPRGWQPIVRGFLTDWLAPGYPRDGVHLTAYPANPQVVAPSKLLGSMLGIGRTDVDIAYERVTPLHTSSGLAGDVGESVLVAGMRRVAKLCAVLHDVRFVYALEVTAHQDTQLEAHREELQDVFASVQPIPSAQERTRDYDFAAQGHWIE